MKWKSYREFMKRIKRANMVESAITYKFIMLEKKVIDLKSIWFLRTENLVNFVIIQTYFNCQFKYRTKMQNLIKFFILSIESRIEDVRVNNT